MRAQAPVLCHPAQLALLRADSALVGNAVEEMLRYDNPVQASRRITLEPVTAGSSTIPAGAYVMASLGSANRDKRFWGADADELRLDRDNARQHVSFGAGHHHCLGASLARLEAAIAFEHLVGRFPGLALAGDVVWNGRINALAPPREPCSGGAGFSRLHASYTCFRRRRLYAWGRSMVSFNHHSTSRRAERLLP